VTRARVRPAAPCALLLSALAALACSREAPPAAAPQEPDARGHLPASETTRRANARVAAELPLDDPQDFEDARRGLVASEAAVVVEDAEGRTVWDTRQYGFVAGDAPASVNPSLWRQERLNGIHGLFEVADGVYQVRGYDLANMTLVRGETGWIVVDPLTARETSAAALALARRHLGDAPVVAVVFTHSHIDHFGGVEGVLPPEPAARAGLRIVAPAGFLEEATSENVMAGVAMGRRATFMYGMPLERSPRGHVGSGLGKAPARGGISIAVPTDIVDRTPQPLSLDGVTFVFQYTPHTEAPAELTFYLPDARAFCGAEIVSHNLHNLYTLRGAKVRDALLWSGAIDLALRLFPEAEVVFASHHWPTFGRERVADYLASQRDVYRFIHDQTLRLANQGATPREIAEHLELPATLRRRFANRDYYGTLRHNAKAVYQFYFGWYDGNPANLDPLPPAEAAVRYVAAMGGAEAVREQGRAAYAAGDYRWAATLLDHLVFADPGDAEARELLAATYDQLGYQAESGPWRDVYLSGALELRHGVQGGGIDPKTALELLRHLPLERFFEAMATRLSAERADGEKLVLNLVFTDVDETWVLSVDNSVLHHQRRAPDPDAAATLRLTRDWLLRLSVGEAGLRETLLGDALEVEGSRTAVLSFFRLLDRPGDPFAIVTP
jgi:alkyl sulfatase BDS1-like metallo-beta-lactamase superfamily hydrolase